MSDYWFKPKTHGYGATPCNWKGWAATGAFVVIMLLAAILLLGLQPKPGTGLSAWSITAWALIVAALTIAFVWLARAKTDGQWGWRWGK
jgi:hypothetical protein